MSLALNISPKLIKSIVTMYNDSNRVFMEYIDNAIDSADKHFFNKECNSYIRPIEIRIWFQNENHKNFIIRIQDNCAGIEDITKITSSLGDSEKANNSFLNGQFGFGMYSFMAVCNTMRVTSKVADKPDIRMIELHSELFNKKRAEEVNLGTILHTLSRSRNSWTTITLSDFIKDKYREISVNGLKREIEKHFEIILSRRNIKIIIVKDDNPPVECKAFDYAAFDGPDKTIQIKQLEYTHSKRYSVLGQIKLGSSPVKIYLKVIKDKAIDRKPFFVIKGRRIADVADIKAFRTCSKSLIWSHPNVTGYIDATGILEPTIARNEFKNTRHSKSLFRTLLEYEDEIKAFVEENVNNAIIGQFHRLESILSKAMSDLAQEINKKERNILRNGNDRIRISNSKSGMEVIKNFEISTQEGTTLFEVPAHGHTQRRSGRREESIEASRDIEYNGTNLELPVNMNNSRDRDNSEFADSSGFNIVIDSENEPMKDRNDKYLRSVLFDSNIVIYKKHPEFSKRLDISVHGIPKISSSLVTYLCSEILVHYKSHNNNNELTDNKLLFNDFLESLYYLESKLSWLRNKKISEFS